MFLQALIKTVQLLFDTQKTGQPVHHRHILQVFIGDIEGRLTRDLQGMQQGDLEFLQIGQMRLELITVKNRQRLFPLGDIGQFPLSGGLRDLAGHIAVRRVAGQDDLGTSWIGQGDVQHSLVMVMKEPEPA